VLALDNRWLQAVLRIDPHSRCINALTMLWPGGHGGWISDCMVACQM